MMPQSGRWTCRIIRSVIKEVILGHRRRILFVHRTHNLITWHYLLVLYNLDLHLIKQSLVLLNLLRGEAVSTDLIRLLLINVLHDTPLKDS